MGTVIEIAPSSSPITANTTTLFYDGLGNARVTNGPSPTIPGGSGGDFRFQAAWLGAASALYNLRSGEYPHVALIICAVKGNKPPTEQVVKAKIVSKGIKMGAVPAVIVIFDK
jgi:hypothetical protein